MKRNITILCFFIAFAFLTDQGTKQYIMNVLGMSLGETRPVIDPILNWKYVRNYGMNFGLLGSGSNTSRWILVAISSAIALGVLYWVKDHLTKVVAIFAGLVVGGALGNIFDRIVYGSVTDFINNSWFTFENPFAYNLADIWIFGGLFGLLIWGPKSE